MKPITLYESTDGSRWPTPEGAKKRDALDAAVKAIEKTLPKIPDTYDQRVKVDDKAFEYAKVAVVNLCRKEWPNEKVFQHDPMKIHPMSFAGRLISDCDVIPIQRIWHWFSCERDGWLYQQPYYAINPNQFQGTP